MEMLLGSLFYDECGNVFLWIWGKKCITAILWTEITKLYYFSKMEDANDTVEIQTKKSIDYALL